MASSFTTFFLSTRNRHSAVGRTPLDEWSTRRRDRYLTTHNTHNRQTSMPRWDWNSQSQQASSRLRPRGQWDRLPVWKYRLQFRTTMTHFYTILVAGSIKLVVYCFYSFALFSVSLFPNNALKAFYKCFTNSYTWFFFFVYNILNNGSTIRNKTV